MRQVRDRGSAEWRDVTGNFYWDMGRLFVFWPGQSRPSSYACANSRWRTSNQPTRDGAHRLRFAAAEAA